VHSVSFIVDDVPEDSQIKKDLKFLETISAASCPEIVVDTGKKRGVLNLKNWKN